ncbi:RNA-binding protein [Trypanosoma cruzi Dm28c]|uniref:RNA-binding protein n=2 Tax=Trypanosoma cruzi TaxID=5693 RepID=V5BNG3_TRYCR|nr:RNA-binding protein [Trypanosoma cruzi Dm28c]PBJ70092.1 RNA-binding protein [Trypanosoma cruzi cruzi]PBJ78887.1 RNA-binding protein [Trypanosoma cruzi cruzi]PWV01318.1 putative RNA-binding protein [Trypanosoma cruzi]
MSYAGGTYYANQEADAYYYGQQQQMAEEENTIDFRPPDITEHQDKIIQLVAKYVVFSCDGARYQHLLIRRTKFNSYFAFVASPEHKYHEYYQYLIRSYIVWRDMAAATSAGEGNTDEGYAFYTEQLRQQEQQQQQQQQYQANMYYTASTDYSTQYTDPTAAAAMTTTGGYYDANTAYSLQQKQNQNTSVLGESSAVVETSRGDDVSRKRARSATPQESSDEEDDAGRELVFVMENGVARALPK